MEKHSPSHFLRPRLHGLYVITTTSHGGHLAITRAALAGGARLIQLRDKNAPLCMLLPLARELRRATRSAGALFLINDRVDLALASGADGVHLGPDDMPVEIARTIVGPHVLIGASCGDAAEAKAAERAGADYIGAGDVFGTATKADAGTPIGIDGLRSIMAVTELPVVAIGAINATNIAQVAASGAAMAGVISAVAAAGDAAAMIAATRLLIERAGWEAA